MPKQKLAKTVPVPPVLPDANQALARVLQGLAEAGQPVRFEPEHSHDHGHTNARTIRGHLVASCGATVRLALFVRETGLAFRFSGHGQFDTTPPQSMPIEMAVQALTKVIATVRFVKRMNDTYGTTKSAHVRVTVDREGSIRLELHAIADEAAIEHVLRVTRAAKIIR